MPRPTALVPVPRLRSWRLKRMLTQRQLAERAHLALSVIGRLEAGAYGRFSTVMLLAEALEVEPSELMRESPAAD